MSLELGLLKNQKLAKKKNEKNTNGGAPAALGFCDDERDLWKGTIC